MDGVKALDLARLSDELAIARRHVIQGRDIVERQRQLIATMKADGHSTLPYEELLEQFQQTLRTFEDHERILRGELAELQTPAGEKTEKASE